VDGATGKEEAEKSRILSKRAIQTESISQEQERKMKKKARFISRNEKTTVRGGGRGGGITRMHHSTPNE